MVPDFNSTLNRLSQADSWEDFDHQLSYLDLPERVDANTNQVIAQIFEAAHERLGSHAPLEETNKQLYTRIFQALSDGEDGKHKYHALAAVRTLMGPNIKDMPIEVRDMIFRNLSIKDREQAAQVDRASQEGVDVGTVSLFLAPIKELIKLANDFDSLLKANELPSLFLDGSEKSPNGYVELRLDRSKLDKTLETCSKIISDRGSHLESTLAEIQRKLYLSLLGVLAEKNVLPNGDIVETPILKNLVIPEEIAQSKINKKLLEEIAQSGIGKKLLSEASNCYTAIVYPEASSARVSNLTANSTEHDFLVNCNFLNGKSLPEFSESLQINSLISAQQWQCFFLDVLPLNKIYVPADLFLNAQPGDLIYFPPQIEDEDCGFVLRVPNDPVFYENIQKAISKTTFSNSEINPLPLMQSIKSKFVPPLHLQAPQDNEESFSDYSDYGDDDYRDLSDDE